ncbi:saccharopine dehydrogenase family protein [Leptospira idonii]|uniref:Saccharopine dehydrogenase n=1 Tax=Leptospira idonii TaxID=1193500 RepID=A0A4R9LZ29_9LEPT|nr:saccharopine dehydrogenase NADP-binding domain-containing protein [Leptospira idonii]TGN19600.1 Saccharopine dehydrogenase [Leptospira idonii]
MKVPIDMYAKDKILILGGNGQVGKVVIERLYPEFKNQLMIASRSSGSIEKKESFYPDLKRISLNIKNKQDWNKIPSDTRLVVVCLDQNDTDFLNYCMENQIRYLDISASSSFISLAEKYRTEKKTPGSIAVLGVGLAPGLTNLLTKHLIRPSTGKIDSVDISVLLGLGENHGKAAIEWTIDNLNKDYFVLEKGIPKKVSSFTDPKKADFGAKLGTKTAYRFDFCDQHILPKTLRLDSVSTRLSFDSGFITNSIAVLKKLGVFSILRINWIRNLFVFLFQNIHIGSEDYALHVKINVQKEEGTETKEAIVAGTKEGEMTGKITALAAKEVFFRDDTGIFYMEEVLDFETITNDASIRFDFIKIP